MPDPVTPGPVEPDRHDSLEEALRRLAQRSVDASSARSGGAVDADPATSIPRSAGARRPVLVGLAVASAAVVILLVVLRPADDESGLRVGTTAPTNGVTERPDTPTTRTPPSVTHPPPDPGPRGPVWTWLSAHRLPESGADLVVVTRNRSERSIGGGVAGGIERWDGASWIAARQVVFALDHWNRNGELHPVGPPVTVPSIGIPAEPGKDGPPLFVRIEGLEPGWYRFGPGPDAMFEVVDAEVDVAPIGDLTGDRLAIAPALAPPGDAVLKVTVQPAGTSSTAEGLAAFDRSLSPRTAVERWRDGRWVAAGDVEVGEPISQYSPVTRVVELRGLTNGAYRMVRTRPDGGEVIGVFWVEEP